MAKVDVLEGSGCVEITYSLMKPMGTPVENGKKKIGYEKILELPEVPEKVGLGENKKMEYYIKKIGKTLVVVIDNYCEKSSGPDEEDIYGPYLKE